MMFRVRKSMWERVAAMECRDFIRGAAAEQTKSLLGRCASDASNEFDALHNGATQVDI